MVAYYTHTHIHTYTNTCANASRHGMVEKEDLRLDEMHILPRREWSALGNKKKEKHIAAEDERVVELMRINLRCGNVLEVTAKWLRKKIHKVGAQLLSIYIGDKIGPLTPNEVSRNAVKCERTLHPLSTVTRSTAAFSWRYIPHTLRFFNSSSSAPARARACARGTASGRNYTGGGSEIRKSVIIPKQRWLQVPGLIFIVVVWEWREENAENESALERNWC